MKTSFTTAWNHIRRSPYQALAAILTMFLTFFVISLVVLLAGGSQRIMRYFETRPQVTAFFKEGTKPEEIDSLRALVSQTGKTDKIRYVSKEEALEIYREQNKKDPLLLEMVTANILPASLEIATKEIGSLQEIATVLRQEPQVEEVVFQEDVVAVLKVWTTTIRRIGIGLIVFLALVSFLTILIVIGMKVALRKEEVSIMRLVGASGGFVRNPFILEGIFYGVIGAILGWGISYLLLLYSTPFLVKFLSGISLLPVPFWWMLVLLGTELAGGMLIGIFGSIFAVKRYLK